MRKLFYSLVLLLLLAPGSFADSLLVWGNQRIDSSDFVNAKFTAISAGSSHSLALKTDGTIIGWGYNGDGLATWPAPQKLYHLK